VDFVWTRAARSVTIEAKAGRRWRREDGRALKQLVGDGTVKRGVGIYRGERRLRNENIEVLPVAEFLRRLGDGRILD